MKLEIDLADREEIAAAVPLLQLILSNTPSPTLADFPPARPSMPCVTPTLAPNEIGNTPRGAMTSGANDPAVVFGGGAQPADPLALSIPPIAAAGTNVPPPPENSAPTTTTLGLASSVAGAASVELDSKGLPWDERIHAGSKGKLKDGNWRAKKEIDPATVAAVEAELYARVAASLTQGPNGGVMVPANIPLSPEIEAVILGGTAPAASSDPTTFEQLMPRITAAVTAGIIAPTAVGAACAAHGVASVVTLQTNPQFVPLVWATLKQQYPSLA